MSLWYRLLYLLGRRQASYPHTYHFTTDLHTRIADLAHQEQRTPDEYAEDLLSQALRERHATDDLWQRWHSLSSREQQVVALICLGLSNRQIAARLGLGPETIKSHVSNVLHKFEINNRTDLRLLLNDWDFSSWK